MINDSTSTMVYLGIVVSTQGFYAPACSVLIQTGIRPKKKEKTRINENLFVFSDLTICFMSIRTLRVPLKKQGNVYAQAIHATSGADTRVSAHVSNLIVKYVVVADNFKLYLTGVPEIPSKI